MAGEGEGKVIRVDAATVIDDADQLTATLLDIDLDPARAGIDCVFE